MARDGRRRRRKSRSRESSARSNDDADHSDADRRILNLRQHITDQHALLVEQQEALRLERHSHARTAINAGSLCKTVAELVTELAELDTDKRMQTQHAALLEQTLAEQPKPPAVSSPVQIEATMGRLVGERPPEPATTNAPPPTNWFALALEYSHPGG